MYLRKESGGTTITWKGTDYTWPADDPGCEVPQDLGEQLLAIKGGGYTQAEPPKKAPAKAAPAPAAPAK